MRDGTFREHRADDFVTKISPVEYVPLARSERFEEFIDEITCRDKVLFCTLDDAPLVRLNDGVSAWIESNYANYLRLFVQFI